MYWMDLRGGDPTFYRDLFGWQPDDAGVFTVDGQVVAGHGAPGAPGWNLHAVVDDVPSACRTAESLGGSVLAGPVDAPTGTVAALTDPTGALFLVRAGGPRAELLHKPNLFSWAELCTPDPAAAKAFYTGLFGWSTVDITMAMPAGEVGYSVFMSGTEEAGGLLPAQGAFGPEPPPYWLAFVEAADAKAVAAQVTALGGEVLVDPFDVPRIGRIALFAGRGGERFAVMELPAEAGTS
jgi:uncharacterized protein